MSKTNLILFLLFGCLGALIVGFGPALLQSTPEILPTSQPEVSSSQPELISLPRLGIELPIKAATVSANDWQIYDNAASWLKSSGTLEGGNIILYGHNTQSLFGNIIQLGNEDEVILTNGDKVRKYQVIQAYQTTRDDLRALQVKDNLLTMYTCSGWFDQYRFFVIAKPIASEQ